MTQQRPGFEQKVAKIAKEGPFWRSSVQTGSWSESWADDGLVNGTTDKTGLPVTLPVILFVGADTFMAERTLTYTATAGKSGQAR